MTAIMWLLVFFIIAIAEIGVYSLVVVIEHKICKNKKLMNGKEVKPSTHIKIENREVYVFEICLDESQE